MNIRDEIEIEYFNNGRLIKHPSGVEVFESKEEIEDRVINLLPDQKDDEDCLALAIIESLKES